MNERGGTYLRTLVVAALLGAPVAVAAVVFKTAIHNVPDEVDDVAAAAALRVPFSAVLFASLFVGSSAAEVAPIAVLTAERWAGSSTALPNPEDRRRAKDERVPAGVAEAGSGPSAGA